MNYVVGPINNDTACCYAAETHGLSELRTKSFCKADICQFIGLINEFIQVYYLTL